MKKLIILILILLTATLQFSCKKELNALPSNAKVEGNVILDSKSAQIALNGAYYQLAGIYNYGATPTTNFADLHANAGALLSGYLASSYGDGLYTNAAIYDGSNFVFPMWSNFYKLINTANGVLKGIDDLPGGKIPDSTANRILGEAHFLRAYGHYSLLMYYSQFFDITSAYGVILRKDFVTTNNIVQARSTVKESYDFILADIDEAIAKCSASNPTNYATTWAAKALKVRLLINRAGPGDYAQVISLTQDIIQHGGYALEANQQDIFYQKGLSSNEVILGIYPEPGQTIKHDFYIYYPQWNASQQMKDLLQGDPRSTWVADSIYNKYSGRTSLCVIKYAADGVGETSYVFRLSEMYLLQAEAIARSGGVLSTAKTLLKTVMSKAGITDFTAVDNALTADALLLLINKEVTKNLCYEDGAEWFSLLRFPFTQVKTMRPTILDKIQYILPIPKAELQRNGSMKQNPGYPSI